MASLKKSTINSALNNLNRKHLILYQQYLIQCQPTPYPSQTTEMPSSHTISPNTISPNTISPNTISPNTIPNPMPATLYPIPATLYPIPATYPTAYHLKQQMV
eukprot:243347_1